MYFSNHSKFVDNRLSINLFRRTFLTILCLSKPDISQILHFLLNCQNMKWYVTIVLSSFVFASWFSETSAKVEVSILKSNTLRINHHFEMYNPISIISSDCIHQYMAQVVSTTCQAQNQVNSEMEWMTCPLSAPHSPPKTFREFEHYKASQKEARKFCCGTLSTR